MDATFIKLFARRWRSGWDIESIRPRDRRRYLRRFFEVKKRLGLHVLGYAVTSNLVQLLISDTGPQTSAQIVQLLAGRATQEY